MSAPRRRGALLLGVLLSLATTAAAQPPADAVRFAADAEKARGHLLVSEQLYMVGQARAAALHAALLEAVAEEYDESFKDARITQLVEYQDGYGFFRRARAVYDTLPANARKADADTTALSKAFPSSHEPPKPPIPAKTVKELTDRIAGALTK